MCLWPLHCLAAGTHFPSCKKTSKAVGGNTVGIWLTPPTHTHPTSAPPHLLPPVAACGRSLAMPPRPPGEALALCGGIGLSSQSVLWKRTLWCGVWVRVISHSQVLTLRLKNHCVCVFSHLSCWVFMQRCYSGLYNISSIQSSLLKSSEVKVKVSLNSTAVLVESKSRNRESESASVFPMGPEV